MNDSVKDLISQFVVSLEKNGKSRSTILAYRADLDQLLEFATKNNLATIDKVTIEYLNNFKDMLISQKFALKTVSRKLNAVKTFFKWALANRFVKEDPSKSVEHPKIENVQPKFLTPLEYRALRDAARSDSRIYAMIELILQTGLRISEVANLKKDNVGNEFIKIEGYSTQPERTIPINKPAKDALDKYLMDRPDISSDYLFVSKTGKPLAVRNIRASVDRFIQKAELPKYSVNDLRTTFIVENIKNGVDLVLLSQIAGHKRLSTTEKYLKLAGVKESGNKQALIEL
jgi:site-specific recombinase XerD